MLENVTQPQSAPAGHVVPLPCADRRNATITAGQRPKVLQTQTPSTGGYSKYLPTKLAATHEQALADENLHVLNKKMALIESRLVVLIERVEEGGGQQVIRRIDKAFTALRAAMMAQDKVATESSFMELSESIAAGKQDSAIWQDIYKTIDQFRKLSESERKRMVEAE
jgi:hypothetical protein